MTHQQNSYRQRLTDFLKKKYHDRGINGRVKKLGGWGAIAERKIVNRLSKSISDEIDKQILKQLIEYAQTDIHS